MAKKKKEKDEEKKPPEGYIIVNAMDDWLQRPIEEAFADNDFMKIILFYVLHSPCKKGSYSRIDLENYGWKNPWYYDDFKSQANKVGGFTDANWHYKEAQKDFKEYWESLDYQNNFYDLERDEFVVFSHVGESNPFMDLLHHIRNSFAHGRFTAKKIKRQKDYYIYMEDVSPENGFYKVNARMILKKSTLLALIDFFTCKSGEAKKICQDLSQRNTKNGKQNAKPASRSSKKTKKS